MLNFTPKEGKIYSELCVETAKWTLSPQVSIGKNGHLAMNRVKLKDLHLTYEMDLDWGST